MLYNDFLFDFSCFSVLCGGAFLHPLVSFYKCRQTKKLAHGAKLIGGTHDKPLPISRRYGIDGEHVAANNVPLDERKGKISGGVIMSASGMGA